MPLSAALTSVLLRHYGSLIRGSRKVKRRVGPQCKTTGRPPWLLTALLNPTRSAKVDAMILVRRLLTIPLGIFLFVFILLAVVFLQASGSFLDPGYYVKELRKANVYEFLLVDLVRSGLDEARELDSEDFTTEKLDENPLVTLGLSTDDIASSINTAIPPEWVQSLVEEAFAEVGRYVTGEQDEFTVTLRAGDRVDPLVTEFKSLLRKADAYNLLFEELVDPAIDDALTDELPLGLEVTGARLSQSVRRVVPPDWIQEQVEAALDEIIPYATGERDTFEIRVPVSELVETALDEIKELLRETDAYDLLYDEVVEPKLTSSLGDAVQLPFGFDVTSEEIVSSLRRVAPPSWVQDQAEMVIDAAGPYLTGEQDGFSVNISLVDNKRQARDIILELASQKLLAATSGGPECTTDQLARLKDFDLKDFDLQVLQECSPTEAQSAEVLDDVIDTRVIGVIPENIRFTENSLRDALSQAGAEENLDLLDDVREIIRDGWTYTDQDLREDIRGAFDDSGESDDATEMLDDARDFLSDGWTYGTEDFREDILQAGDEDALDNFDDGRDILDLVSTFRLVIYLPVLLLLVAIGFLGGRGWSGRFAWAAGALLVTSAIVFVAFGPVYNSIGESQLDDAQEEAIEEIEDDLDSDFPVTERLAIDKVFEISRSVINGFASGIAGKSLVLLIIGAVGLVVSLRWRNVVDLFRRIPTERIPIIYRRD